MPVPQGFSAFFSFTAAICAFFPIIFPISAGLGMETGSNATASATNRRHAGFANSIRMCFTDGVTIATNCVSRWRRAASAPMR